MLVGIKDASKLTGVSIITFCAVFVCTIFLNFYFDILLVKSKITSDFSLLFYNAQVATAKVICIISGSCLLITSAIMLIFYIRHYIDTHKKELGMLKALGYSNFKIAKNFCIFGTSTLIGAAGGFGCAFLIMPKIYALQNSDGILPDIAIHFHPSVFVYFVIIPSAVFSVIAVLYSMSRLKTPVLLLLKNSLQDLSKKKKYKTDNGIDYPFITDLRRNTLKNKKVLVFFIIFASFCFSSMTQMSFSMKDLSSEMMGIIIMIIGLVLAFVTMLLAITTVVNSNRRTIAMMRVFGYSQKECCRAILGGYRPFSYIGFAVGTVYQYMLLRIMVDVVFKDIGDVPEYKFDFILMLISLISFIAVYEIIMYIYSERIKKISVKEIMEE